MVKEQKETVEEKEAVEQAPAPPRQDIAEDMVRQINAAADKLKVENARFEANQQLAEAQRVEKMLAGHAEGGVSKKEETPVEYRERIMRGEYDV